MKLREGLVWVVLAFCLGTRLLVIDGFRAELCEYSKYKTNQYKMINGKLYCQSSDNSFQRLTKYKPRSKHMDEHKTNWDAK